MKLITHYSSSQGNLYTVETSDGRRLMIEAGVSWKKIQEALGWELNDIDACLCTHLHKDHSKALRDVLVAGIDVYASVETLASQDLQDERRAYPCSGNTHIISIDGFMVFCFEVEHDCPGCLGYLVQELKTGETLFFATDTSYIRQKFDIPFSIIAIECSYDSEILHKQVDLGEIHEAVAKRLLTSHMERSVTLSYLQEHCNLSRCREINLLHMSGDRIDKAAACRDIENALFIETKYHRRKK